MGNLVAASQVASCPTIQQKGKKSPWQVQCRLSGAPAHCGALWGACALRALWGACALRVLCGKPRLLPPLPSCSLQSCQSP